MSTVERLMPELAGAGPRTRAAVTVAAAAMPGALAGEVALTASGRAAGSSALAYAIVMAGRLRSVMAGPAPAAAVAPGRPPGVGAPPGPPRRGGARPRR